MPDAIPYTANDLDFTTRTVIGEADNQGPEGQAAVAWVVRNRSQWKPAAWWGHTPTQVCLKNDQFSCWRDDFPGLKRIRSISFEDPDYRKVVAVVRSVFAGEIEDPTKGATHYQVVGTGASWSKGRPITAIIGAHEFFALGPDE